MQTLKLALAAGLAALYLWTASLIFRPDVSEEYRAYFIDRSTTDWRPPKYPATPAEGMDFARKGLPSFVVRTYGISAHEKWGRWTDARLSRRAGIMLETPLSGNICLGLEFATAPPQAGKPVRIRIGTQERTIVPPDAGVRWYYVAVSLDRPAHAIEIEPTAPAPPRTWAPGNSDPRRLALALRRMTLRRGDCPTSR